MPRHILYILYYLWFGYCSLSVLYLFIFSLFGKILYKFKKFPLKGSLPSRRIAILIPAYREDNVIVSTVQNLLQLDYPRELYTIYVIADSFRPATLMELAGLPVEVMEVSFTNSTVAKSLNEALRRIEEPYDIALICDGDNMLSRDFLILTNDAFVNGARVIQGRRVAKNLNTSFAFLDACSEAINNHIFRKGANAMGLSSPLSGSGMAFEFSTLRAVLREIDAVGFDKILQLRILQEKIFIYYLYDAIIYDEKVDSPHAFRQQRRRWLSTQLIYSRQFLFPAFKELSKGNISYFNLAVGNYCMLPKAFLFIILPMLVLFSYFVQRLWGFAATGLWLAFTASMILALPRVLVNNQLWQAILSLPRVIFLMFAVLLQQKHANRSFIHTPHVQTQITNPGEK